MKEEYLGMSCSICGAMADGLHYGAVSCRSCNAFFRRAVSYNQKYDCRYNNQCDVTVEGRCSCRACRFRKCVDAGMKVAAVQPRRDPTGSQKERRKRQLDGSDDEMGSPPWKSEPVDSPQDEGSPYSSMNGSIGRREKYDVDLREGYKPSVQRWPSGTVFISRARARRYDEEGPLNAGVTPYPIKTQEVKELMSKRTIKDILTLHEEQFKQQGIRHSVGGEKFDTSHVDNSAWTKPPEAFDETSCDPGEEFERMAVMYKEHVEQMRLNMLSFPDFLEPKPRRAMTPDDVEGLSKAELAGLLYWISKMKPYATLPLSDRTALLKRYSVRKLSLDHFYVASQHREHIEKRNFCMLNNTYVPPGATGFELNTDDPQQIAAKQEIFRPTFERIWRTVIIPFEQMQIQDIEIVFLHGMLLWSPLNSIHVEEETRPLLKEQREWFTGRLNEYYLNSGMSLMEAGVRMGQIILVLAEVELICNQHCHDFQVCKLFEFCDMSRYWYEQLCYSKINTMAITYADECRDTKTRVAQEKQKAALIKHYQEKDNQKAVSGPIVDDALDEQTKALDAWKSQQAYRQSIHQIMQRAEQQLLPPQPAVVQVSSLQQRHFPIASTSLMNQPVTLKKSKENHPTQPHQTLQTSVVSPPDQSIISPPAFNKFDDRNQLDLGGKQSISSSPPELEPSERFGDSAAPNLRPRISGPGFGEMGRSKKMKDITMMLYSEATNEEFLVKFTEDGSGVEPPTSLLASPDLVDENVDSLVTPPPPHSDNAYPIHQNFFARIS
ncbi:unnamed protein product, partial [Mesorhabditis belari]|uniref:Uncharacterized protein n=1 Tax=Mesorhabditis belari TaxID=2138241 RepID=A0AAF3J4W0_9BILA